MFIFKHRVNGMGEAFSQSLCHWFSLIIITQTLVSNMWRTSHWEGEVEKGLSVGKNLVLGFHNIQHYVRLGIAREGTELILLNFSWNRLQASVLWLFTTRPVLDINDSVNDKSQTIWLLINTNLIHEFVVNAVETQLLMTRLTNYIINPFLC